MICSLIDNETGEVINGNVKVDKMEDIQRRRQMAEKDKLLKEYKEMQQKYLGNFVFFIFKNLQSLEEILSDADLVKFIYIGTYVKNNGALMMDNNITYIDKKRFRNLINVSNRIFRNFYNKLIDNNLLKEDDKKLYINLNYFWRGRESIYKKYMGHKLKDFTRIYIKATRDLYEQTESKNHKKLSMIYKLIPFVNWKFNILAENIEETDKSKVKALSINDILQILNYSKNNLTRFKNDFYGLRYNNYKIFGTFLTNAKYKDNPTYINPIVLYRGNNIEELGVLINMFELKVLE